jgi:uncharacterized protein involved in response to NO
MPARAFFHCFRPFFLGVWAALAIVLWLPQYFGHLKLPTALPPLDWHIHEMIYGDVASAVAGFLLTATPELDRTDSSQRLSADGAVCALDASALRFQPSAAFCLPW